MFGPTGTQEPVNEIENPLKPGEGGEITVPLSLVEGPGPGGTTLYSAMPDEVFQALERVVGTVRAHQLLPSVLGRISVEIEKKLQGAEESRVAFEERRYGSVLPDEKP
jgi:hypothetical protein